MTPSPAQNRTYGIPSSGAYLRFTPSYRDVEELLARRGLSCESVRCWVR